MEQGGTQDVVINIDPNVTVANFALFDTSRSLNVSVTGASGNKIELDPIKNGVVRIDDPSTMVYLGYGFNQPKPGKWIVTLESTDSTPASGADYAIAAQFSGGALLQTTQDVTTPRVNQQVTISGVLTVDDVSILLTSANAVIHAPNGSTEVVEMNVNGGQVEVKITPQVSGIYGVEIDVTAQSSNGDLIDRAAFLTFEAEPTPLETMKNQIIAGVLLLVVIIGIFMFMNRRRRRVSASSKI